MELPHMKFPLAIDDIIMQTDKWVIIKPKPEGNDVDVIAHQFFKKNKKGQIVFKTGTCVILFHIPNDVYDQCLAHCDLEEEKEQEDTNFALAVRYAQL